DRLIGGGGIDNLYGNGGAGGDGVKDAYVFAPGGGTDFLYDFDDGTDQIDLRAFNTDSALSIVDANGHALISIGGTTIVVVGAAGKLDASDFSFTTISSVALAPTDQV